MSHGSSASWSTAAHTMRAGMVSTVAVVGVNFPVFSSAADSLSDKMSFSGSRQPSPCVVLPCTVPNNGKSVDRPCRFLPWARGFFPVGSRERANITKSGTCDSKML
uniref:(northern house mosquito) hypothetical protein n=1 Tax=Culex pipiens TaxID=7175 RepID=A0A8D8EVD7_CULPI